MTAVITDMQAIHTVTVREGLLLAEMLIPSCQLFMDHLARAQTK